MARPDLDPMVFKSTKTDARVKRVEVYKERRREDVKKQVTAKRADKESTEDAIFMANALVHAKAEDFNATEKTLRTDSLTIEMAADEFEALHNFWQHQIAGKNRIIRDEDELTGVIMKKEGSTKKVLDAFETRVKLGVQASKAWTKSPKFRLEDDDDIAEDYEPPKKSVKVPQEIKPSFMKDLTKHLSSVSDRQDRLIAEKSAQSEKFEALYEEQKADHAKKETVLKDLQERLQQAETQLQSQGTSASGAVSALQTQLQQVDAQRANLQQRGNELLGGPPPVSSGGLNQRK